MYKTILSGLCVLLLSGPIAAQPIDVVEGLNSTLAGVGTVPVTRWVEKEKCTTRPCGPQGDHDCEDCKRWNVPVTDQKLLTVGGPVEVIRVEKLEFGDLQEDALPGRIRADGFRGRNCSSVTQTRSVTLSVNYTRGSSVTIARNITNGGQVGMTLTYMGSGVNASVTRSISLAKTTVQTEQESLAKSESVTQPIAPMTELWASLRVVERNHSVPFTARVVVDAPVSGNAAGISKASQVLEESQRAFVVSGVLSILDSSDAVLDVHDRPLSKEECSREGEDVDEVSMEKVPHRPAMMAPSLHTGEGDALPVVYSPRVSFPSDGAAEQFFAKLEEEGRYLGVESATPSFLAGGTHQCQSRTSLGHTCQVSGAAYTDCNQAYFSLRAQDCCPATPSGGTSIGFWVDYCVPY